MPLDPISYAGAIVRDVKSVDWEGNAAKAVIASATYPTTVEDLWEAITTADRIRRWFLPISGDLRLGGRYQLEGNAGGTITACDPPMSFATTWEMGGQVSWLSVRLSAVNTGAALELTHTSILDDSFWPTYGPGAVGVGWDLGLFGLSRHIENPAAERPPEADSDWPTSAEALNFYRLSATAWGEAAARDGMPNAEQAAENTRRFYSGEPPPAG